MAGPETISLRDAGHRLAQLHRSQDSVASNKLLSLLQSGQIKAGFHLSVGDFLSWIGIPDHYWTTVSNDKFKVIRYSKDSRKSGAYKVRLAQFANEVATEIREAQRNEQSRTSDKWKAVIAATSRTYEVTIIAADWDAYEQQNPRNEATPAAKSKSGRHEKTGWRDLSAIIGAYIAKHYQQTKDHIKVEEASEIISKLAIADGIPDLPAAPTIKEILSKIRARAAKMSIN